MTATPKDLCYLAAASAAAVLGACEDLRCRRIPNRLTGCALVLGLVLHLLMGGLKDVGFAVLAGLCAGGLLLVMYISGGMGAGDVKLMAAVGCLAGISSLREILTGTFLCGAVFGIALAMYHRRLGQTVGNALLLVGQFKHKNKPEMDPQNEYQNVQAGQTDQVQSLSIPYAVPIAAGCLMTLGTLIWKG
jgi:prepilin peptidase CpaA